MTERILTQHPDGKQGVNIERTKYETVKAALLAALQEQGEATFSDLATAVEQRLADTFDGSITWYYTTVKLDLEAREIIERVPNTRPQRLRLTSQTRS